MTYPGDQPNDPRQPQPGLPYAPPGYAAVSYPPGHYPITQGQPYFAYPPVPPPQQLDYGVVGASIAGLGFVGGLLALLALPWYSFSGGLTSSDVRAKLDDYGEVSNGLASAYHGGLAWILLLLCAVGAGLACAPRPGLALGFRIATPITAGLSALLTFGSFDLIDPSDTTPRTSQYYLDHLAAGFWIMLLGFVLLGAGAIVGPRKRRTWPANQPPA